MLHRIRHGNILHLVYASQEELCKAFCRFEEHYESPEFAGKIFTQEEYIKWYTEYYGQWSYYEDWSGFNVPDYAFKAFLEGKFTNITPEEQLIIDSIKDLEGKFYVIGSYLGGDDDVVPHELMHAKFYVDDKYKEEVTKLLNEYDLEDLKKHLAELGYAESVILDECQAYIGASYEYLIEKGIRYPHALTYRINELFKA